RFQFAPEPRHSDKGFPMTWIFIEPGKELGLILLGPIAILHFDQPLNGLVLKSFFFRELHYVFHRSFRTCCLTSSGYPQMSIYRMQLSSALAKCFSTELILISSSSATCFRERLLTFLNNSTLRVVSGKVSTARQKDSKRCCISRSSS